MVSQSSSIFRSYFKEFIIDLYSSTLSSSSESVFHVIHSGCGAFHCVLIYWIFISSILSVWLLFSYSLCWILYSFLVLTSLFHLSFFFFFGVYSRCLLWTVWIELKSFFEFSVWMFFLVILIEVHYYGISNFWRRSIVFDFWIVLFLHWNLHIWTWLSGRAAQRLSVCDCFPVGAGSE